MDIILMTVLLTLLGSGLVVLLVWLSVVASKSIRLRKLTEGSHKSIWDTISTLSDRIEDINGDIRNEITTHSDELHHRIEEVYTNIDSKEREIYHTIDNHKSASFADLNNIKGDLHRTNNTLEKSLSDLESTIDSRFDKHHNLIRMNGEAIESVHNGLTSIRRVEKKK